MPAGIELFARADGSLGASMASPDQGVFALSADHVSATGNMIEIGIAAVGITSKLRADPDAFVGEARTKVRPTGGAYAGTKFAIEALSEGLRMEVAGTGVSVTCIEPGLVMTELHRDWPVHPKEGMNIPHPLLPEDIARCVRFVLTQPPHVRIPRLMILPGKHQV